jgi:hypothetical protein
MLGVSGRVTLAGIGSIEQAFCFPTLVPDTERLQPAEGRRVVPEM